MTIRARVWKQCNIYYSNGGIVNELSTKARNSIPKKCKNFLDDNVDIRVGFDLLEDMLDYWCMEDNKIPKYIHKSSLKGLQ